MGKSVKRTRFSCGEKRILEASGLLPVQVGVATFCRPTLTGRLAADCPLALPVVGCRLPDIQMANQRSSFRSEVDWLLAFNGRIKLRSVTSALKTRSLAEFYRFSQPRCSDSDMQRRTCQFLAETGENVPVFAR